MINLTPPKFWYKKSIISYVLLPFSFIYLVVISLRKFYYQIFPGQKLPVPIIIVGNITVGGAGKTPLVIYLAELLKNNGYNPGIISRGYGGKSKNYPLLVTSGSKVEEVGDEALLIARRTQCPMIVGPKKNTAIRALLADGRCSVVISDDGLQHYALPRDIEIAVIDAFLSFGNEFCLPAGPLREPIARLQQVDFIVKNYNMHFSDDESGMLLEPIGFYSLKNSAITKTINEFSLAFSRKAIHAIAGIGNPQRFFSTLRQLGLLNVIEHPFPDHYSFRASDLLFDGGVVIMTEKDAVKCDTIAGENCWYLKIEAKLSDKLVKQVLNKLYNL
ncbi:MAG: tetraacyldisaccharide 4'-kinase [bacterium]